MTSTYSHILGHCITITDENNTRHCYLAEFDEVPNQTHPVATRSTEEVLLDFGCLSTLKKGFISLSSDYGLHAAALKMTFNVAVDPNHTIDRLIRRTLQELPELHSAMIKDEFSKTIKFARNAKHCLSKKALRREPAELFPSLNDYLSAKLLTPIQTWCETRFRSLTVVIETIAKAKDVLLELEKDDENPNQRHLASLPSFRFIMPLHDMLQNAFKPVINFADSQQFQQNGELISVYESLLSWACIPTDTNNFAIELKKCLVSAIMEQILDGKYVWDNQEKSSLVKNRLLSNELVAMFGCPPRKKCRLEKIRFILKKGGFKKEAELVLDYVDAHDLKEKAISQIKKYDLILNSDRNDVSNRPSPRHSGTESSELSDEEPAPRAHSSSTSTRNSDSIESELKRYEKDSGEGSYENFKLIAKELNWDFRKSAKGLILQNSHLMEYWKLKKAIFPRLANIMLFVLRTPCSSSPLERFFSSINLQTSSHASNRTVEYIEQINQINPKNDQFITVMNNLFQKYK